MIRLRSPRVLSGVWGKGPSTGVGPAEPDATVTVGFAFPWRRLVIGLVAVGLVGVLAASQGSVRMPPATVLEMLVSRLPLVEIEQDWSDAWDTILWQIRLPRIVLAALVGGALATAGATYQGLFRNPLAEPSLIGAASGAGLGATVVLATGVPLYFHGMSLLPIAAFTGAVAAVAVAYLIARRSEGVGLTTLILAGVAIASLTSAVTSLLMIRSDPDLRLVLSWLMGSFVSAQWKHSLIVLPYLAFSGMLVLAYGRILNVFHLNEEHALQLGVTVERTKVVLIGAATMSTAAAVAFTGPIVFVGLIAPHAVRMVWGGDYRFLLPMSAIVGAGFLIVADLAARTLASPAELPVGIVTAFCGAPFFLYLLRRRRRVEM